jgi:hypothetical protein
VLAIIAISIIGLRALLAITNPPLLDGNPISIVNLHRQLTSPIEVLKNTIGEAPLAMKIVFNGSDEGNVQFNVQPRVESENLQKRGITSESDLHIPRSVNGSQENIGGDATMEEHRVFMERRRTAQELQQNHTVSPESMSERYSWTYTDYIPVQMDYDRT